jgi:chitin disaccharide deacetylase
VSERVLIVNADDFGLSRGVNAGIIDAHRNGIVTSTSLMVRCSAAAEAVELARDYPKLSIGLHLDLGEWVYRDRRWQASYQVIDTSDRSAVETEIATQMAQFHQLMGRTPTHLDSHQHVHRSEPVRSALLAWATKLAVPVRHESPRIHYCGDFYGQTGKGEPMPELVSSAALQRLIRELPEGTTELGCHPGYGDDIDSTYRTERRLEVVALCDPIVRAAIDVADIRLSSFSG